MDNLRLILFFSLAFVLLLLYQAWMHDYGPQTAPAPTTAQAPAAGEATVPAVPTAPVPGPGAGVATPVPGATAGEAAAQVIQVETDVLKVGVSTRGGTLESMYLLDYPVAPESPGEKLQLLKPVPPNLYLAQSGLIGQAPEGVPTHEAPFNASKTSYRLAPNEQSLVVELVWQGPNGVTVTKRYTFRRGSYLVDLTQTVSNGSGSALPVRAYVQLQRGPLDDPNASSFVYTYTGAAYYTPEEKYKKLSFEDIAKQDHGAQVKDGWVAMLQHYFVSAWIPTRGEAQTLYTMSLGGPKYAVGLYSETVNLGPGASHSFADQLYAGPKLQNQLAAIAPGLELTVDYGWLTVLAQPIFWLLDKLHGLFHNWGVAIILLTVLIKAAFYKLSETSYKSMANMRKLTPRLQALKDRFGDDKERLNQAMMELYKKEKINPLGGCLPILIQIPVFIALYWVLLESVEMRQAPFALWITNLSAPDPYFVLPLIMGVSMYAQQKLNPAPVDPIQAKVMLSMPFVFTIFFAFFPSGLVLYWVVNNLLSIAQQWNITRTIERASAGSGK